MAESVEVFRDLYLDGPVARRSDVRPALIAAAEDPWYYDPDRSAAIGRNATDADILAFDNGDAGGPDPEALRKVNDVVLQLARIIGCRMAREDFAAHMAAANDSAPKSRDGPDGEAGTRGQSGSSSPLRAALPLPARERMSRALGMSARTARSVK